MTSGIEANSNKISANHATVSSQSPSTATLDRRVPLTDGLVEHPHMLNSRGVTSGQLITNFMTFTAKSNIGLNFKNKITRCETIDFKIEFDICLSNR
jgi:hypothetical protein